MRRVHARGSTPPELPRKRSSAPRRSRGSVSRFLGVALAVFAAGCASSGAPEVSREEAGSGSPASENPATTTEATAATPATEAPAPAPATPAATPVLFSENQADRGRTAFDEVCTDCHTTSEFRGRTFQSNWGHRTVYSFFRTVRSTMPDDNPGGLEEETYLDVVSYILRINGHSSGASEMTADSPMREVRMAPPDAGS